MPTLTWTAEVGATYSVYRATWPTFVTCPASTAQGWVEIADGITPNTFTDTTVTNNPPLWCYAVTSHINGVESAFSVPVNVAIGESGYVAFFYTNTCSAGGTADEIGTAGSTAVFTEHLNGVTTVLPVNTLTTVGGVGWQYHLVDNATYTMKLLWNDGTVEGPFPVFESKTFRKSSTAVNPIHIIKIRGTSGAICYYDESVREQITTP